jgi:hypothetical protein
MYHDGPPLFRSVRSSPIRHHSDPSDLLRSAKHSDVRSPSQLASTSCGRHTECACYYERRARVPVLHHAKSLIGDHVAADQLDEFIVGLEASQLLSQPLHRFNVVH